MRQSVILIDTVKCIKCGTHYCPETGEHSCTALTDKEKEVLTLPMLRRRRQWPKK